MEIENELNGLPVVRKIGEGREKDELGEARSCSQSRNLPLARNLGQENGCEDEACEVVAISLQVTPLARFRVNPSFGCKAQSTY